MSEPAFMQRIREERAAAEKYRAEKDKFRDRKKSWLIFEPGDKKKVRILPDPNPEQPPYRRYAIHYGLDRPYLCMAIDPTKPDWEQCPLCNYVKQLRGTGDSKDKEDAYQLQKKDKAVYRAIDRANDSEVKKVAFSSNYRGDGIHDQIVDLFLQTNVADPYNGHDFDISRPLHGAYKFQCSPIPSKLAISREKFDAILEASTKVDIDEECTLPPDHMTVLEGLVFKLVNGEIAPKNPYGPDAPAEAKESELEAARPHTSLPPKPACFANASVLDTTSQTCSHCDYLVPCKREVAVFNGYTSQPVFPGDIPTPQVAQPEPAKAPPQEDKDQQFAQRMQALREKRIAI